ncbi:MAG: helix-turn-helix transcriptional regulator [Oscillospiraceae bacterium]|nr:helix-turn-helix transcriptional regulator [Oscillospiraceae bacterium]
MGEIIDSYTWTKEVKLIPHEVHRIPGLANFTYYNHTASSAPTPIHAHSNIIEIHCLIKGTRYTNIEKNGQIIHYTTSGNQAFITYPFELHSNGEKPLAPCEFYAMQIDISDPRHMLGLNESYSLELVSMLNSLSRCLQLTPQSIALLKRIMSEFSKGTARSYMAGCQYLTSFIFLLETMKPVSESSGSDIDPAIQKAIAFLDAHLDEKLSLSDLSDASGYSLSRFKVKFKAVIGITPAEYITWQKIEKAKLLLVKPEYSVTDVAYQLGFSSSNYFSSVFKKKMNCTPLVYKKRNSLPPGKEVSHE